MRSIQKVGVFDSVASGKFTTLTMDPSGHYYGAMIKFEKTVTANFVAMNKTEILNDLKKIDIEVGIKGKGSKVIVSMTPERLFAWLDWRYGTNSGYVQDGCIPIPFTRNKLPNIIGTAIVTEENALGLGTLSLNRISVALTFKTATIASTRVTLVRDIDEDINVDLGTYPVLIEEEREISTVGTKPIRDLKKQVAGAAYLSAHFTQGAAGVVTEIETVKLGSKNILQNVAKTEHDQLAHQNGRKVQTGYWHVDFQRSRGMLSIDNTKDFEINVTWSTAPAQYFVIHDMLEGIGQAA